MPLMFVPSIQLAGNVVGSICFMNFFVSLMYEGKLLPYGCSHWSTNWDIIWLCSHCLIFFVGCKFTRFCRDYLQNEGEREKERRDSKQHPVQ